MNRAPVLDMSIKEASAFFARAARGAGFSWGLSEEVGYAVAWIARAGQLSADMQEGLARFLSGAHGGCDCVQETRVSWMSASGRGLCPVSVGSYIADLATDETAFDYGHIVIKRVVFPILIVPFVGRLSSARSHAIEVSWPGVRGHVKDNHFVPLGEVCPKELMCISEQPITLNFEPVAAVDELEGSSAAQDRVRVAEQSFAHISQLAAQTHVPETEALQQAGAGDRKTAPLT